MKTEKTGKLDRLELRQTTEEGKRVSIYVRVSSNELKKYTAEDKPKRLRESVNNQIEDGIAIARKNGWGYEVYKRDCNISGIEDEEGRIDFKQLCEDIKAGKIHRIIARDPYRISRNAKLSSDFLHNYLIPFGVNVIFTDVSIDLTTAEGREAFCSYGWKGQAQLQYISKVSKRGRERTAKEGNLSGKPPFGFKMKGRERNAVAKVDSEAAIVKRIFDDYVGGKSVVAIRKELVNEGIQKSNGKSNWTTCDLSRILKRVQYIGKVPYNGKAYPSPYTPIVEESIFEQAQQLLKTRANNGNRNRMKNSVHLLQGILKCGHCLEAIEKGKGSIKRFENMTVTQTQNRGKAYFHYVCQTQKKEGHKACDTISVSVATIEAFVRNYILESHAIRLPKNDDAEQIATLQKDITELNGMVETLSVKKSSFAKRITELDENDYVAGVKALTDKLNKSIASLTEKEEALKRITNNASVKAVSTLDKWDSLSVANRRSALKDVISAIIVRNDSLEVVYASCPRSFRVPLARGFKGSLVVDIAEALKQEDAYWNKGFNLSTTRPI